MRLYLITNTIDGTQYIGKTTKSVTERWRVHVKDARRKNKKYVSHLHRAIRKYGADAFRVEELPFKPQDERSLNEWEKFLIDALRRVGRLYNMTDGGENPPVQGGSKNSHAVVNEEQVKEIRALFAAGVCQDELMEKFNLAKQTLSNIVQGHTWAHVSGLGVPRKPTTAWQRRRRAGKTKGVYWRIDRQKWYSTLTINGKVVFRGSFPTEQEARNAYDTAVSKHSQTA